MEEKLQNKVDQYGCFETDLRAQNAVYIQKGPRRNVDVLDCSVKGMPVKRR